MREYKKIACTIGCVIIKGQEICDNPLYYYIEEGKKRLIITKKRKYTVDD
ncbi:MULTISPECIES: hypothetical protein [Sulfolobaceae]|nr:MULTISPECIES: hypothetical protein [unclassified Sulfolobus]